MVQGEGAELQEPVCFQVKRIAQEKGCIFCVHPFLRPLFRSVSQYKAGSSCPPERYRRMQLGFLK